MATKITETLIDDLSGEPAHETVMFGLDGVSYEIDLTQDNAAAFRAGMYKYLVRARKVKGAAVRNGQAAEIRRWGRENGYEVPTRGRIPVAVRTAWSKEHDGIAPVTLQR